MTELPLDFEEKFTAYKQQVISANSESAKAFLFLEFVRAIFGDINAEYLEILLPQLEIFVKVKQGAIVTKGRIDALLGNLIIEFKQQLDKASLEEAQGQLKRYLSAVLPEASYLALASDGVKIFAFLPRVEKKAEKVLSPEDVILDPVDEADLSAMPLKDAFLWLDRYLLSKELRPLTTESFSRDFGIDSLFFKSLIENLRKAWQAVESRYQLLFREWADYLSVVYGTRVETEDLFLRHTYLATIAKLMAYMMYSGGAIPTSKEVEKILSGTAFKEWGILNFLERDFFSWVADVDDGIRLTRVLANRLSQYDIRKVNKDILKGLYQELVDPKQRHDLGEYYTPDWLAEYMVERMLGDPQRSILDPACGSGTFLAAAIGYKRAKSNLSGQELLSHILGSVVGVDVHPLATIIAKTNYLIALGKLLQVRTEPVYLPVYLSDSIKLEAEEQDIGGIKTFAKVVDERRSLFVPAHENEMSLDQAIEMTSRYASSLAEGKEGGKAEFDAYLQGLQIGSHAVSVLYKTALTMAALIKERGDTIWAFVLRNFYKPMLLRGRFDAVIGNPPWLPYRFVKTLKYQDFLKALIKGRYALTQKAELITHLELATLFFLRSSELYLKDKGEIGFVMTKGVFQADQHYAFREGSYKNIALGITALVDLENVEPLFNVPACLVFGRKGIETKYPIKGYIAKGKLPQKNATLEEAEREAFKPLELKETHFSLCYVGERSFIIEGQVAPVAGNRSYYYGSFKEGATIVPRQFWFIEVKSHPQLGVNIQMPYVVTSSRAKQRAKTEYQGVELAGNVESPFLYATLTSSEVVPFGHLPVLPVVLPIRKNINRYVMITSGQASVQGFSGLAQWLENAKEIWSQKGGRGAVKDIYDRLDRMRGLSAQSPLAKFKVLYAARQTNLAACVVDLEHPFQVDIDGAKLPLQGFVADYGNFYYETELEEEAHYLAAILNSGAVNMAIKPMLTRGQFGERNVCNKVLELPIPKYEPANEKHQRLSQLGKLCSQKVEGVLPHIANRYRNLGKIRGEIRKSLVSELGEIDAIVLESLSKA